MPITLTGLRLHYDAYLSPDACASGRPGSGREHMTDLDRAAVVVAERQQSEWADQTPAVSRYIQQATANEPKVVPNARP